MAKREEQEDAREQVSEVAPGVARMELPIRMPGLGHVNCFVLIDEEGAAVVDPVSVSFVPNLFSITETLETPF